MGGLLGLFRRGPHEQTTGSRPSGPTRVTEQDKAVFSLKQQRDKLQKYQKKINDQLEKERELAKRLLRDGKREKAKLLLKKKRYLETLLTRTDTQLDNLQQMVDNIEFTQIEMKVVEGLKQGNECLEAMHKLMSVEDVERIMEETQDSIEYQREIDELLGQNLTEEDEEAIADELDSILAVELPEVPSGGMEDIGDKLPEVPTETPTLAEPSRQRQKREAVPA